MTGLIAILERMVWRPMRGEREKRGGWKQIGLYIRLL
jgi:hypothetical protein